MEIFTEGFPQTVQDMAALRDSRREQQARLFRQAGMEAETLSVVMLSLVIPGPIKNNRFLEAVFDEGCRAFLEQLAQEQPRTDGQPVNAGSVQKQLIAAFYEDRKESGCTAFWLLNAQAEIVKRQTTALERTHPLGILWDLDVFSAFEQKLSAFELGLPARSCLICSKPAKLCARSRTHSVLELQAKISDLIRSFFRLTNNS